MRSIWIGYDPRETEAFAVCRRSLRINAPSVPINPLDLPELRRAGLYARPTSRRDGQLWDDISEAPMSTEFAVSRFLTPILAGSGLALFMDCDILARHDLSRLWRAAERDRTKAVWVVQHDYTPNNDVKMDGQAQTKYARKNWSSVILFNCDHPSNRQLTVELINSVPGRDLHRFCWLDDSEIGALDAEWNFLVGITHCETEPSLVHFTNGGPWFEEYREVPYADEWLAHRRAWLRETSYAVGMPFRTEKVQQPVAGSNGAYLG